MPEGRYTFLPWMKTGFSGVITETELSGSVETGRPELQIQTDISRQRGSGAPQVSTVTKDVELRGPGDILSIKSSAIVRTEPHAGVLDYEWNYLPYVEFYDEDFPWRYTPAAAHDAVSESKLRLSPWIYLLVLKKDEFELDLSSAKTSRLKILDQAVANSVFVPHDELWAWAHVQFNKNLDLVNNAIPAEVLAGEMADDSNLAISRLLSPRKLEVDTDYQAFVIPTFQSGRLTGLGLDFTDAQRLEFAWPADPSSGVPLDHPFYHTWSFRTAVDGDFERLADKIIPKSTPPEAGVRPMDIQHTGWGVDADEVLDKVVGLESALRPPTMVTAPFIEKPGNEDYVESLETLLNANDVTEGDVSHAAVFGPEDDPLVLPPMYGQWHALKKRLASQEHLGGMPWFEELNLDPRNRAVGGLGSTVVKHHQEEFMEEAWE